MTRRARHSAAALLIAMSAVAARAATTPHHRLTIRLDPAEASVRVTDRIRLDVVGDSVHFELDPRLEIEAAHVDGTAVRARRRAAVVVVAAAPGSRELALEYRGRLAPSAADDGSEASFVTTDGTLLVGDWYPRFSSDDVTYELSVEVADGQIGVVPGKLLSESRDGSTYRAEIVSDGAVEAIYLFAGPFEVAEHRHGTIAVRTYFHRELASFSKSYLDKSSELIGHFSRVVGPYPFSHFYVVSSPIPVGYGFPGVAYLSRQIIPFPYVPETSLGHEVLHDWWGNGVRVAAGSGNWAEGLTTFQADYAFREAKGKDAARDVRLRWLREYAILPRERDFKLASFRSRAHTASQVVGYHKTAYVFLMLRDRIGEAAFDAALRHFWLERRSTEAAWSDLRAAFEASSGENLAQFFDQWLERTGAPTLSVGDTRVAHAASGYRIDFRLAQPPPAYALSVPVRIDTATGSYDRRVDLSGTEAEFAIEVPDLPIRLQIDPDLRLFRRLAPQEVPPILREVAFDTRATTLVVDGGEEMNRVAAALAEAFFEAPPHLIDTVGADPGRPLLVVGTGEGVAAIRQRLGITAPPLPLVQGTAQAWASRTPSGRPIAFVEGEAAALDAIKGPLPHYGSQSFVVFEGRRAVSRGLWQLPGRPLVVELDDERQLEHGRPRSK